MEKKIKRDRIIELKKRREGEDIEEMKEENKFIVGNWERIEEIERLKGWIKKERIVEIEDMEKRKDKRGIGEGDFRIRLRNRIEIEIEEEEREGKIERIKSVRMKIEKSEKKEIR